MTAIGATHEVQVEAYRGPLDLLLYLIKDEEVDIYDIPIARILDRYLRELAKLETVDINSAAEFILMAATLMEIKSRLMLPPEEREALDLDEEDPRTDLVRQLLEYRRFRQAADELGAMAERRSRLFGRAFFAMGLDLGEEEPVDAGEELRDVEIFDLLSTFEALMKSILAGVSQTTIYYDDVSVEERIEELVLALRETGRQICFSEFSKNAADRADAAGIFSAILEATRRKLVTIYQPEPLGELYVALRGDSPDVEFAPPPEEQPRQLTEKEMVARRGVFGGFIDLDEEEDLDFAFDTEGRKAIARLEAAVDRADQAIKSFTKPKRKPDEAGPAGAGAPRFGGPQKVTVRQWTDLDRRGQVVTLGGADRSAVLPRARRFGPSVRRGRLDRRGLLPARIANSSLSSKCAQRGRRRAAPTRLS
jgi:segregation and condensation protein A